MFNFGLNIKRILRENLPVDLRVPERLSLLKAMAKPIRVLYTEFLAAKAEYQYKCQFNGQVIYLQTSLNDRFDPVNRAIYISSAFYDPNYVYSKTELKQTLVVFAKWNSATAYVTGQKVVHNNQVWIANANSTNKVPGVDPQWTLTTQKTALVRSSSNYNGALSFIVNVPVALVFSQAEMDAHIKYYIFAGFGYQIKTF